MSKAKRKTAVSKPEADTPSIIAERQRLAEVAAAPVTTQAPRKPFARPAVGDVSETPAVAATEARKPFTIRHTVPNLKGRTGFVVGGLWPNVIEGHQPYISPMKIAKALKLDTRSHLLCDVREAGKIEACRQAGLKEYGIEDYVALYAD